MKATIIGVHSVRFELLRFVLDSRFFLLQFINQFNSPLSMMLIIGVPEIQEYSLIRIAVRRTLCYIKDGVYFTFSKISCNSVRNNYYSYDKAKECFSCFFYFLLNRLITCSLSVLFQYHLFNCPSVTSFHLYLDLFLVSLLYLALLQSFLSFILET